MTDSISKFQDVVTDIRKNLAECGEKGILLIRITDGRMMPLFQAALLRMKSEFYQKDVFPALQLVGDKELATAYLAPCCLALGEAIEILAEGDAQRAEDWKRRLFEKARITIENSHPEIVADMLSKMFTADIAEALL
ncbi:hypothetical protein [Floridanema evergladense]|uniref:Uncharacterized protein n=1 Tax=Floridaenema evergladense BLCC-F167 TaxID=3153639 RepID=A0ABV4WEH5_9CYAN